MSESYVEVREDGSVRLAGTLAYPEATVADVLTVQADGSIAAAAGGGSSPSLLRSDLLTYADLTGSDHEVLDIPAGALVLRAWAVMDGNSATNDPSTLTISVANPADGGHMDPWNAQEIVAYDTYNGYPNVGSSTAFLEPAVSVSGSPLNPFDYAPRLCVRETVGVLTVITSGFTAGQGYVYALVATVAA